MEPLWCKSISINPLGTVWNLLSRDYIIWANVTKAVLTHVKSSAAQMVTVKQAQPMASAARRTQGHVYED